MKNTVLIFVLLSLILSCSVKEKDLKLVITNPSDFDRTNEIVEIKKASIFEKLQLKSKQAFIILNESNEQIAYQLLSDGETIILPVSVKSNSTTSYKVKIGVPENFNSLVYGKFVPERKDDFAWENNKVAFRMYGPALEASGEISNGIDFWAKRTEKLIIDKWYADEFAGIKTYHTDGGEGLDFYKVGRSLGLGAMAPYIDGKLILGKNFIKYKIIENGPLRFSFELSYAPFSIGENDVKETRRITLNAYSQLNKIEEVFESSKSEFPVAIGLVVRNEDKKITFSSNADGVLAYEEPKHEEHGTVFVGAIYDKGFSDSKLEQGHFLGILDYKGSALSYYAGAVWSKFGFSDFEQWKNYLLKEKEKIDNPLQVKIER